MNWGVSVGYESSLLIDPNVDEDGSTFDFSVNAELGGANVWFLMFQAVETSTGGAETEADMH